MFEANLLRSLNIYVVENISHTLLSAVVVAIVLAVFRVKRPSSRLRLLLLPVVVPFLAAPFYYVLYPERSRLALLPVDAWLNVDALIGGYGHLPLLSHVLIAIVLGIASFLLIKGLISLVAMFCLPRQYRRLSIRQGSRFHRALTSVLGRSGVKWPTVLVSPERTIECCTFGFMRRYLLISQGALDRLSSAELEAMVAHEVGHLHRGDGWLGFIVVSLRNMLFFNPVAYLLCQRVLKEAELAADDLAVAFGPGRLAYAESLVSIGRSCQELPNNTRSLATYFFRDRASIKARVLHILGDKGNPRVPGDNWLIAATSAGLVVGLFFVC